VEKQRPWTGTAAMRVESDRKKRGGVDRDQRESFPERRHVVFIMEITGKGKGSEKIVG